MGHCGGACWVGLAVDVTAHLWVNCWVSFLVLLLWFEWGGDQTPGWEGLGVVGVWRDSCVGRCLRVAMVVLPWMECGWFLLWPWWVCLWVLVLCLFRGLGLGQAGGGPMGRQDFWSFSHEPSCLLLYFGYGYYSSFPFLSNSISFSRGKNYEEKSEKSSGTGTNFHLAVKKGCVQ